MTQTVPLAAQLGSAYTGDTIHYRILNGDGTEYATWTSSGVTEIGTTGTYFVASLVNAPDAGGFVQWSNDAGSTTLAAVATIEAAAPTAAAIRSEIDANSTKLDATISSRLASASYTAAPDAAGIRSAVGLASANLDTQLSTIDGIVDSILADTGTDGVVISTATAQAIADAVLSRGVDNVEDSASIASLAEVILGILESSRTSTTWTIRKTDGTTFGTRTLTLDGDAEPVTGVT